MGVRFTPRAPQQRHRPVAVSLLWCVFTIPLEPILNRTPTNRTPHARGDSKLNRTLHGEFRHSPASAPSRPKRRGSTSAVLCPPSSPSLPTLNLFCAGFF